MSSTSNATLQGCVTSLRSSMQLLDSSINILDSGVCDYPRLAKVLQSTKHFELVSESDLHTAQSALLSEIKPEVESLLSRVDVYLDKLQRREQSLMAKCELQSGRLKQAPASSSARSGSRPRAKSPGAGLRDGYEGGRVRRGGGEGAVSSMEEIKMQQLRQRKERLSYAVGRLELQASQKERQLRRSMAGPGFGLVDDDDDE